MAVIGEKLSERQKYDFKRSLEEVSNLKGRGTELISLYVPPEKQVSDVAAYLRGEYSQSSNIKSQGRGRRTGCHPIHPRKAEVLQGAPAKRRGVLRRRGRLSRR